MSEIFSKDLLDALNPTSISTMLLYIVPGLCLVGVFNFVYSKRLDVTHTTFASVVISFILMKIATSASNYFDSYYSSPIKSEIVFSVMVEKR